MSAQSADTLLNDSFLDVRAKLLEVAAALDRIDRAKDTEPLTSGASIRRDQIQQAIELLLDEDDCNRAEKLQQLFSREYQPEWRTTMKL